LYQDGSMIRLPRILLVPAAAMVASTAVKAQEYGPARGALVISGGAETTPEIYQRFIELAGGADAPILVVPTSGSAEQFDDSCECLRLLREAGARNLRLLHTRDRAVANGEAFIAPLRTARGVWFAEGNSWRHADAYLDTRVHQELFALLDRGGVIGGGSAGARIQGEYVMLRSPEPQRRAIPREAWRRGFRLLRHVAIDVHVLVRNRQFDLIGVVKAHPELLGIAMDENTAIVVRGDVAEVIGESYVLIYDNQHQILPDSPETLRTAGGYFYALRRGDRFNLQTRQVVRPGQSHRPIDRLRKAPWPEL
jgi:cyanophycinase